MIPNRPFARKGEVPGWVKSGRSPILAPGRHPKPYPKADFTSQQGASPLGSIPEKQRAHLNAGWASR